MIEKIKTRYWDMAAVTYDSLLAEMDAWRREKLAEPKLVCFCDANGLAHGWNDEELAAAYQKAVVCADGGVMLKLAKFSGGELPGRCIGPILFERAMEYGVSRGWKHYFYGTNEETLAALKAKVESRFRGVQIVGTWAPEYADDPQLPPLTSSSGVDFLWVAIGSPKQEKWCARHLSELKCSAVLAVGAAFDFHAGTQKRAPAWVDKLGVCWIWRMLTGGSRVLKRDLWCVPRAAWILISEWVRMKWGV